MQKSIQAIWVAIYQDRVLPEEMIIEIVLIKSIIVIKIHMIFVLGMQE